MIEVLVITTAWQNCGVQYTVFTSVMVTSFRTLRALKSYIKRQSSEKTRILPRGPGKILSIFPRFFFTIGHFFVLPPSKLEMITSLFESKQQILSLLVKKAVSASPLLS
jgi:hypothetical protein